MMRVLSSIRDSRSIIGVSLVVVTTIYLLFVVLPFYGNGINLRPYSDIAGSAVDFKGYEPFAWPMLRIPTTLLAWLGVILTPILSLILAPAFLVSLRLSWGILTSAQRWLWGITLAVNVSTLLLTWQSLGLIGLWLAD